MSGSICCAVLLDDMVPLDAIRLSACLSMVFRKLYALLLLLRKLCALLQVDHGYAGLRDVRKAPPKHDDTQQSFFLAETLKYLYLMYGSNDEISLDEWVFNTEAHPLRIVQSKAPTDVTTDNAAANAARQNVQDEVNKAPLLVDKAPVDVEQTQGLNGLNQAHADVEKAPEVLDEAPDVLDERTEQ